MSRPAPSRLLAFEERGNTTVIRFTLPRVVDEEIDLSIGLELAQHLERSPRRNLVLDLGGVNQMSTSFVGKIMWLLREVKHDGGSLRLCGVRPSLLEVFTITKLDKMLSISAAGLTPATVEPAAGGADEEMDVIGDGPPPAAAAPSPWRHRIEALAPEGYFDEHPLRAGPPATPGQLRAIEAALHVALPSDLRDFLTEMDGVQLGSDDLVWDSGRIVAQNRRLRTATARDPAGDPPLGQFLFFADPYQAGNLVGYCFAPLAKVKPLEIVEWGRQSHRVLMLAHDLESYLRAYLNDELEAV